MEKEKRLAAFINLGKFISDHISGQIHAGLEDFHDELKKISTESFFHNGWFTPKSIEMALSGITFLLEEEKLREFAKSIDRKSTRLNSSHVALSRMPSSA